MSQQNSLGSKAVYLGVIKPVCRETPLSEKECIELVQRGNKDAYQAIVKRYMRMTYYIVLSFVHNHQDALDLSQDSFVKAFRKIKMFDPQKPFFPWFYKLTKNLCLDHLKKRNRHREVPLEDAHILDSEKEDREMKQAVWRGIEALPLEQREAVILRYFQQLSYKEIAELTGKPIGTVMSTLYYAKKRLKGIMGKYLGFE
jgi:RNA polymerase sigma-70 factor (ECF subfamily)